MSNVNGALNYSYLLDPCTDPGSLGTGQATASRPQSTNTPCATSNMIPVPGGGGALEPLYSSYQCGIPFQYSVTQINNLGVSARETDIGLYAEDDWKVTRQPHLELRAATGGAELYQQHARLRSAHVARMRCSTEEREEDDHRAARRVREFSITGLGWAASRTSFRTIRRTRRTTVYQNLTSACTLTPAGTPTPVAPREAAAPAARYRFRCTGVGIRAPYMMESAATVEQQVGKYASVSVTYMNARGEHQFLTRVFSDYVRMSARTRRRRLRWATWNATSRRASSGRTRSTPASDMRTPKGTSISGYYSANWANSNLSGITNPYNSATDYGRATFGDSQPDDSCWARFLCLS